MTVALTKVPQATVPDHLLALARQLSLAAGSLDLFERVKAACDAIEGPLVFTTSFGLEDQAIGHAILSQNLAIDLVTLDTGRLFAETSGRRPSAATASTFAPSCPRARRSSP